MSLRSRGFTLLAFAVLSIANGQQPASDTPSERAGCNLFFTLLEGVDRIQAEHKSQMNRMSLVIHHSYLWPKDDDGNFRNLSYGTELTPSQRKLLTDDLNELLRQIRWIDINTIRRLYGTSGRSRPFHVLKVQLSSEANLDASACVEANTIVISPLLIERVWLNSINEQTSLLGPAFGSEPDFSSPEKLFVAIDTAKPKDLNTEEIIKNPTNLAARADYDTAQAIIYGMVVSAERDYRKALLFILAHEAAHQWLDRCPNRQASENEEVRADDYGLIVSMSWLGEQFTVSVERAEWLARRKRLVAMYSSARSDAQRKVSANAYPSDVLSQLDKIFDQETAKQSDADIHKQVDDVLPLIDDRPLGRIGFETFVDVYERAKLTEAFGPHPSLNQRLRSLEEGYATQNLKGRDILLGKVGTEERLIRIVDRNRQRAVAALVGPVFTQLYAGPKTDHTACQKFPN